MAEYNLGRVGLVPKGTYSGGTAYQRLDVVTYLGSSYMALKTSLGVLPTVSANWQQIAQIGKSYNPKGAWVPLSSYVNDLKIIDVVSYNGVSYYCVTTHMNLELTPDIDTTNWGVLVNIGSANSIGIVDVGNKYEATTVEEALQEVKSEIDTHKEEYMQHLNSNMPHQVKDLQSTKKYKFGLQLSAEGNPQIIYEEVI